MNAQLSLWLLLQGIAAVPLEGPSELAKLAASMKPGTWSELKTEGYSADLLKVQNHHILEYTDTAVWDPKSEQVLFVGQGHYSAVKFIAYSAASNSWKLLPTPIWWKGDPLTGKGPIGHAYQNNTIDPAKGLLYHHQSATRLVHRYDIAKGEWSTLPEIKGAAVGHGTALAYFPERKGLVRMLAGVIHFYDEDNSTWTVLKHKVPMGPYHNIAKYNSVDRSVILGAGNGSKTLHRLDAQGSLTVLKDAPFVIRISSTVTAVDPVSGEFLVLSMEDKGKFYALNLKQNEWRRLPDAPISEGVTASIDTYGVTMYFANRPAKVYLYKHAASPLTKTTDPVDQAKPMLPESRPAAKLVFSVRTWEGDYATKDIPGGVASTPVVGAIYTIDSDGGQPRKVVELGKNTDYPAFHPDGKWLYFQSNATGRSQIYRCRPDGSGITNLTAGNRLGKQWTDAYGYALSRDGAKMVYTVHDGSSGRVVLANSDGTEARLIAPDLGYIYMASLSPTCDRMVCSGPARGYRLLLVRLQDGKVTNLTPDHPESFVPQFTPDGNTIVFLRRDGDIYRVDADGTNLRRLTKGNGYVEFKLSDKDQHGSTDGPHVSPDGRRVAYIAVKGGVANVCVMDIDGSSQRQITFRKTPCGRVRWSPDGKELAFVSFEDKYPQLFTVPAEGGEPRQRTRLGGAVFFINWMPASRPRAVRKPKRRAGHDAELAHGGAHLVGHASDRSAQVVRQPGRVGAAATPGRSVVGPALRVSQQAGRSRQTALLG